MGTWGAGLFKDDTAMDVRADWNEAYRRSGDPEKATKELLSTWDEEDDEQTTVVILSLAMCQWKHGCLLPKIKARALKIADNGVGLEVWQNSRQFAYRRKMYTRIAATLRLPQPKRRFFRPRNVPSKAFKTGQLLSYRCRDGEFVLLWIQGRGWHKGERIPRCAALDWKGRRLPNADRIRRLKPIVTSNHRGTISFTKKLFARDGSPPVREPRGLPWSPVSPTGWFENDFDRARVQVLEGQWRWDLVKQPWMGSSIPKWTLLDRWVAGELSTTQATFRRLRRAARSGPHEAFVPRNPITLAPFPRRTRPLAIDFELPAGKKLERSPLLKLTQSRHKPAVGDIFVINVLGRRWLFGRVILNNICFGNNAHFLVYLYRREFSRISEIRVPMKLDLIIPPRMASRGMWSDGTFVHLANLPLDPCELPMRHVFCSAGQGMYEDENGMPIDPPGPRELVGDLCFGGIGHALVSVLGLET
jgi:hypothetical protein